MKSLPAMLAVALLALVGCQPVMGPQYAPANEYYDMENVPRAEVDGYRFWVRYHDDLKSATVLRGGSIDTGNLTFQFISKVELDAAREAVRQVTGCPGGEVLGLIAQSSVQRTFYELYLSVDCPKGGNRD